MPIPIAIAALGAIAGYVGYKLDRSLKDRAEKFPSVPRSWWEMPGGFTFALRWQALEKLGKTAEVRALLDQQLDEYPKRGSAYAYLVSFLARQKDWVAARNVAAQLLLVEPDHPVAHYFYATCQSVLGNDDAAQTHYRRFLELEPSSREVPAVQTMLTAAENRRAAAQPKAKAPAKARKGSART